MLLLDAKIEVRHNHVGLGDIMAVMVPSLGMVIMSAHTSDHIVTFHNSSPVGERTVYTGGGFRDYHGKWIAREPEHVGFNLCWKYVNGKFELKSPREMNGFGQSLPKILYGYTGGGAGAPSYLAIIKAIQWALEKVFTKEELNKANIRQAELKMKSAFAVMGISNAGAMREYEEAQSRLNQLRAQ